MRRKTVITGLILIGCVLFYYGAEYRSTQVDERALVSALNPASVGLDIFYQTAGRAAPGKVGLFKKPLYRESDLPLNSALLIFSPRSQISKKEQGVITKFVSKGGTLFLSFDSKESLEKIKDLLSSFELPQEILPHPNFKDQELHSLHPEASSAFFEKDGDYPIYSRYILSHPGCRQNGFECFVVQKSYEQGRVVVISGLPLIANALIPRSDNSKFAWSILSNFSSLMIDEYHHLHSDHTFSRLLANPRFSIPLFSMLGCIFLFFLFGHNRFQEESELEDPQPRGYSYHRLNENILLGGLSKSGNYAQALAQHRIFLERLFPEAKEKIRSQWGSYPNEWIDRNLFLKRSWLLIQFHQQLLP